MSQNISLSSYQHKEFIYNKNVSGFKYPLGSDDIDTENLQQIQIYFGVHEVIASLEDLKRYPLKSLRSSINN